MKCFASAIALFCCLATYAHNSTVITLPDTVIARVYDLGTAKEFAGVFSTKTKNLFDGSGAVLAKHTMKLVTLKKGGAMNYSPVADVETFLIIKKGPAKVTLKNGTEGSVDRGSVALILQGDGGKIENPGSEDVEYYEMRYLSKTAPDTARGRQAGPSFIMDWKNMVFKAHDKGGVRQLFDRKTVMFNRFDIHVTQLNEGFNSHAPHTHKNEEIILMLEGNAEMQIGAEHQKANPGDVVMLSSNIPHNLTNIGKTACLYFAIQWN
jgi:(S)-ureidoglycine aminohydrolase